MGGKLGFAIAMYIVIAVVLEQYDRQHGTETVWAYTGLIFLTYLGAHASEVNTQVTAIGAELGVKI